MLSKILDRLFFTPSNYGIESSMKTICIQIVTYNSSSTIEACLASVFAQTATIDKIVVLDNSSQDDTVVRIQSKFSNVQLIANESNLGYSRAHNLGFDQLSCDFVLTLNPDVILEPTYVERILQAADHHPHVGAFTGKLLSISQNAEGKRTIDTTGIMIRKNRRAYDRCQGEQEDRIPVLSSDVFAVSGAAAVYRKAMLEEIKIGHEYFDEDFFAYKEDVDLAWRARLMGWTCMYVDSAVGYHERGWKSGKRNQIKPMIRMHSMKNRYLMMLKNDSPTWFDWFYIIPTEFAMFLYGSLFDRQIFESYRQVYHLFSKMIEKRKMIMRKVIDKHGRMERILFR
jgi:GT2 family glycosyltransferase